MKRIKSFEHDSLLYLVSTPIGNLQEFSPRAIDVLSSADYICSEDTRTTSQLIKQFNIPNKPMISYHEHNEKEAGIKIIELLKQGKKIALTSDAGYPGISDPGSILVSLAIENDIPVSVVNGSNAFIPALISSGLDTSHFYFHGFLDSRSSRRKKELKELITYKMTLIFYESPHRIKDTLLDMYEVFGARKFSICREITKLHEENIYGSLNELDELDKDSLKGEIVIAVEGNQIEEIIDETMIMSYLKEELENGETKKSAIKSVADKYQLKKNLVYEIAMKLELGE